MKWNINYTYVALYGIPLKHIVNMKCTSVIQTKIIVNKYINIKVIRQNIK